MIGLCPFARTDGDWEGWLKFFLRGVCEVSLGATNTARAILTMREKHRGLIVDKQRGNANGLKLLDYLYEKPIISIKKAATVLECNYVTAAKTIEVFELLNILKETTGKQRNRIYTYQPYLDLFKHQELQNTETRV